MPGKAEGSLFDDLSRVASGAFGTLTGVRGEVESRLKQRLEILLGHMNLVTREEFDAVKEMASRARAQAEALEARLAALEAAPTPKPKARAKPKAAPKAESDDAPK